MGTYVNERAKQQRRRARLRNIVLLAVLLLVGAMMDPAIIRPFGPIASRPERVDAKFGRCGQGARTYACVVDGDTFRLGTRAVRITGIDAPELHDFKCPVERALAERAANRLVALLNAGPVDMVGHRLNESDRFGRDLRVVWRGDRSLGDILQDEGLAHRYIGVKASWC